MREILVAVDAYSLASGSLYVSAVTGVDTVQRNTHWLGPVGSLAILSRADVKIKIVLVRAGVCIRLNTVSA